jgi:hypothetical protein
MTSDIRSRPMVLSLTHRERVAALVVASASNPRPASNRAVPASQGLGMTKAPSRSCSARKLPAFSAWLRIVPPARPDSAVERRPREERYHGRSTACSMRTCVSMLVTARRS